MNIELETIKKHLNIDSTYNGDDELLLKYAETATAQLMADTGCTIDELGDISKAPIARHAVLLLIGDYYAYREDTYNGTLTMQPKGYNRMVNILRHYE